ncbi:diguanylate cyclase, partial [Desulfobulbus sp. F4]|nr:diguanylate cyclase [Desulfobulbus sp. F4]
MILFCEECGQRNSITLTPALIETNSFTCQFCRFKSPFPFLDKNKNSTSTSSVIAWHPEVLLLPAAAEREETVFQLDFEVLGVQEPQLTAAPFRQFANLITVEKKSAASFTVKVKAVPKSKGLPSSRSVPVIIFCEENIMTWGTVALALDQNREERAASPVPAEKKNINTDEELDEAEQAVPPKPASAASSQELPIELPEPPPGDVSVEILHQQLVQYKAQLHQARTASFRLQKELSIRRQVMDSQSCGILFVSPKQQILYANPVFLSRCCCTLNAVQAMRLDQLVTLTEPSQTVDEALNEAEELGSWHGKALLQDKREDPQQGDIQPSAALSITRSDGDGEGKEKGFICLLFPPGSESRLQHCVTQPADKAGQLASGFGVDALTGLADRPSFQQYLEDSIALLGEEATKGGIALVYIDLNHFKRINRIFGPGFGDKIL